MPYLESYFTTYQALLYIKQNQPLMTPTTPNGFKICQSTTEIRRVSKRYRTPKHPVVAEKRRKAGGGGKKEEEERVEQQGAERQKRRRF